MIEPSKHFAGTIQAIAAFLHCWAGKFVEAGAQIFPSDNPFDGRLRRVTRVVRIMAGVLPMGKVSPTLDNARMNSAGDCFLEDVIRA